VDEATTELAVVGIALEGGSRVGGQLKVAFAKQHNHRGCVATDLEPGRISDSRSKEPLMDGESHRPNWSSEPTRLRIPAATMRRGSL
jgi:hypothetical protein